MMRHSPQAVCPSPRPSCHARFGFKWAGPLLFNRRQVPAFPPGLQLLKLKLLHRALRTFCEAQFERPLRRAAEQAARLALATGYPVLVFPELFAELAISAMLKSEPFYPVARRSMAA